MFLISWIKWTRIKSFGRFRLRSFFKLFIPKSAYILHFNYSIIFSHNRHHIPLHQKQFRVRMMLVREAPTCIRSDLLSIDPPTFPFHRDVIPSRFGYSTAVHFSKRNNQFPLHCSIQLFKFEIITFWKKYVLSSCTKKFSLNLQHYLIFYFFTFTYGCWQRNCLI
jgi:hypothetical protein